MAQYHLSAKTCNRGAGKGAGGHARYVLRDGPYSTKTVEQVDGATVRQVEVDRASEVVAALSGHMPAWAADNPLDYWDAADKYERANGTVYREIEFALPAEFSEVKNVALAREFAETLAKTESGPTPYTLAIHRSEKDPALIHCHLMLSDKVNDGIERSPAQWFKRAANRGKDPTGGGAPKTQERGYDRKKDVQWVDRIRPQWAEFANRALEQAGHDSRIDHRTLEAQRQEQEQLAEQARERGDEVTAARHRKAADALDRPAQPKKGRVLEHGGSKRAPGQAQAWERYQVDLAERQAARQTLAAAEQESRRLQAELDKIKHHGWTLSGVHTMLEVMQPYGQSLFTVPILGGPIGRLPESGPKIEPADIPDTDPLLRGNEKPDLVGSADADTALLSPDHSRLQPLRGDNKTELKDWQTRKLQQKQKRDALMDQATEQERGPGIRHPDKPRWQVERGVIFSDAYNDVVEDKLSRWYRIRLTEDCIRISNSSATVMDFGDRVTATHGNWQEIDVMVLLAQAKGWQRVELTGPAEFQARAARAFVEAGIGIDDAKMEQRAGAKTEAAQTITPVVPVEPDPRDAWETLEYPPVPEPRLIGVPFEEANLVSSLVVPERQKPQTILPAPPAPPEPLESPETPAVLTLPDIPLTARAEALGYWPVAAELERLEQEKPQTTPPAPSLSAPLTKRDDEPAPTPAPTHPQIRHVLTELRTCGAWLEKGERPDWWGARTVAMQERAAELGISEQDTTQAVQDGRAAYRQALAQSRGTGWEMGV